jgi:CubicO group peptidase (beta-lactamase class C family)
MREWNVRGVSVAACASGEILWAEGFGWADAEERLPVTTETLFQAGSISKSVAAAAVMRQVDAGRLALERDVDDYLKSWKLPAHDWSARQAVTLERILSHTAGLTVHGFPGYAVGAPVPTIPQVLDGAAPANTGPVRVDLEPGTRFRYSGGGTTVAQLVLTDTLREPFPAILQREVLGPAGMTRSTFEQPLPPARVAEAAAGYRRDGTPVEGKRHTYPEMAAAGLWTTPSDLCRFAMAIQASLAGEPGALLSRATAERMTTPVLEEVGLGFFLESREGTTWFGHDGADEGFQALLTASRDGGVAAAVMANSDNGTRVGIEILRGVAEREGWASYQPAPLQELPLTASEAAALVGRFRVHGDAAVELALDGPRLVARAPGVAAVALHRVGADELARRDRTERYRIVREGDAVAGLELVEPSGDDRAEERTSAPRMAAGERLPSELLEAGEIEGAVAAYRALHAARAADPGVAESRLNNFGYQLSGRGRYPAALAVLQLATELYPTSANTYDSLADVALQSGDRERALASWRRVLEALPGDTAADEGFKAQLRANAESKIRELTEASARPR